MPEVQAAEGLTVVARVVATMVVLATVGLMWSYLGPGDRVAAIIGLAICVPPAVLNYRLTVRIWKVRPDLGPVAVMVGTGLRMVWAIGLVFFAAERAADWGTDRTAVANFTTGAYLLTLAVEVVALVRRLSEPRPSDVGG